MTNNFPPSETSCRCGCKLDISPLLRRRLNILRLIYGKPITLTCGARCPIHNAKVGGAKNSAHMSGEAVDMVRNEELLKVVMENLEALDMYMEDPASTPTWIHWQTRKAANRIFKP